MRKYIDSNEKITELAWTNQDGDVDYLGKGNGGDFAIVDDGGETCYLYLSDIPKVIKALQMAQELWGEK